jgi:hypothetical protein
MPGWVFLEIVTAGVQFFNRLISSSVVVFPELLASE